MSDRGDFASYVEQKWVRDAVERTRSEAQHIAKYAECTDAGEPIPQAQRQDAPRVRRCVYRLELEEHRAGGLRYPTVAGNAQS